MRKFRWWVGGIVGAAAIAGAVLVSRWPPINDVETGATPEYPDVQPRIYPYARDRVFEAALDTARATRGWQVTAADPTAGEIQAVAHVFATPFRDDVTVRVSTSDGGSQVHVRSRSRVGRGDLGVNARRIRAYLRALDARLTGGRPVR